MTNQIIRLKTTTQVIFTVHLLSANYPTHSIDTPFGVLILSRYKVVFSPEHQAMFVADIHLGKAATFRSLGVPVPAGTTQENLAKLS